MAFGLPARDEPNWDTKLDASINAVKATADAAQPVASLEAAVAGKIGTAGALDSALSASIEAQTVTVNAGDYGLSAAATAAANVTAIHNAFAAVPEGGTLILPPLAAGEEYDIVGLDLRGKSFTLRADSAPLRKADGATGETAVQLGGSITENVTTLTVAASAGATTLTVASTAGLAAGDLVKMRSSAEVFSPDRPTIYFKGELFQIGSIDSATTLTLADQTCLQDSYSITSTTVTLDVVAPVKVQVYGLDLRGPATGTPMYGIKCLYFDGALFQGCSTEGFVRQGFAITTGRDLTVNACKWQDCNEDDLGYGIILAGVDGATISDCEGRRNRHTVDTGGGATDVPSRNLTYRNVRAYHDKSAGISTHGHAENVVIDGCHTVWCGGGIVSRARRSTVVNNRVTGLRQVTGQSYDHGIMVGDGSVANAGLGGHQLRVSGNVVDLSGCAQDAAINALRVFVDLIDAEISDNIFKGAPGAPVIMAPRTCTNLRFVRNYVDATRAGAAGSGYAVLLDHAGSTDTELHRNVRFEDNIIEALSTRYASCLRITGGGNSTRATAHVAIERNVLDGYETSAIQLNSGFFTGANTIRDNTFPKVSSGPTNTVALSATFSEAITVYPNRYTGSGVGCDFIGTAAPTTGYHRVGTKVWHQTPAASGNIGWVCVTAGTPGTWKTFGAISA